MSAEAINALPLTSANYNVMHGLAPGNWPDLDAYRAYYDWFERYGDAMKQGFRSLSRRKP